MAAVEIAVRADRARDEDVLPGDLPRLARELDPALDELGDPVVEQMGRELVAVRAEGVRLDQLGARADEGGVGGDHGLGGDEVRLLGDAESGHARGEERAGAPVRHDHGPLAQALEETAHRPSLGLAGLPRKPAQESDEPAWSTRSAGAT